MRKARVLAGAILIVLLAATSAAQEKDLLSLAGDLGGVLEWDPLRDVGIISFGADRIALGVGIDLAVINYRMKVSIDAPQRKKGAVWLTAASVTALSEAVQRDRLAHAGNHLRVAAILIDPGHGGKDGGAVGSVVVGKRRVTVMEKDVTLSVARMLSEMLKNTYPDKEILFTRTADSFVSLEDRVVVANSLLEKSKDTVLYISIHANTSPFNKNASGFEVWCLPPEYKRTLLDENSAGKENHEILPILNGMLEEEISLESTVLAQEILSGLNGKVGRLSADRGLRQNDWYVVRNARMPAVLVEVGFVSNPDEAARLSDDGYLKDLAAGYVQWRAGVHRAIRTRRECRCSIDWISYSARGFGAGPWSSERHFWGSFSSPCSSSSWQGTGKQCACSFSRRRRAEEWSRKSASSRGTASWNRTSPSSQKEYSWGRRGTTRSESSRGEAPCSPPWFTAGRCTSISPPGFSWMTRRFRSRERTRSPPLPAPYGSISPACARSSSLSMDNCRGSRKRKIFDKRRPVAILVNVTPKGFSSERSNA